VTGSHAADGVVAYLHTELFGGGGFHAAVAWRDDETRESNKSPLTPTPFQMSAQRNCGQQVTGSAVMIGA
jgi:hypothetical protein